MILRTLADFEAHCADEVRLAREALAGREYTETQLIARVQYEMGLLTLDELDPAIRARSGR